MSGFFLLLIVLVVMIVGGSMLMLTTTGPETSKEDAATNLRTADQPEEIISLAQEHESNRQWDRAHRAWSKLIETEPERTDAYFRRGLVSYRQEDYENAVEDFQRVQAEAEDPPPQLYLYTARAHYQISQFDQAYESYKAFHQRTQPDDEVIQEMADLARELERWSEAREHYNHLIEHGSDDRSRQARLSLAEIALKRDLLERLEEELAVLQEEYEQSNLSEQQELQYWYLRAQYHERRDEPEKADRYYRLIFQRDPEYRDVQSIMEQEVLNLDPESLVNKLQRMDQEAFEDFCRRIVEGMDYEVVEADWSNPEELSLVAREKAMSLRVTRLLFEFKQWQEQAGELAIKEFEFRIVENRYDKGFFVNPAGYKSGAQRYAQGHEKINLMGASEVIEHLHEWYRSGT
jgi:tetratricopeptide (TPR) repeat protein